MARDLFAELKFRDPARARALAEAIRRNVAAIGRPVSVMHVCGSHEQAIARFGLRAVLPEGLQLIMGPGCPVCVTDGPEVDEAVALAAQGVRVCTYGDMLRLPGTARSLAAAMDVVASIETTNIEGYIAAGHAAIVTGFGIFEPFAARTGCPVVVAGFEPLDILAAIAKLTELMRDERPEVFNAYPRCVSREGNLAAQKTLWKVFRPVTRKWRGIAEVKDGNLDLRPEWAAIDARRRFAIDTAAVRDADAEEEAKGCICGSIMLGLAVPTDCPLYQRTCVPDSPVGACMVSSEGQCRIWHTYGGTPDLRRVGT